MNNVDNHFSSLPLDLWKRILFTYGLNLEDCIRCQRVCKLFNSTVSHIPEFQYSLGISYFQGYTSLNYLNRIYCGKPCPKDESKAVHHLALAAKQGYAEASLVLGKRYFEGRDCPQDWVKAADYFALASKQGNAEASYRLGSCHFEGKGRQYNLLEFIRYFKLAADQGHAEAQCTLGLCYLKGEYCEQDPVKAVHYFKLSADQDTGRDDWFGLAHYHLGQCYLQGKGCEQNPSEALRYLEEVARTGPYEEGHGESQYTLACLYFKGDVCEQNVPKALGYLLNACGNGIEKAAQLLVKLKAFLAKRDDSEPEQDLGDGEAVIWENWENEDLDFEPDLGDR